MARVNIYLPDELAVRAKEAKLNISALTRSALEHELARSAMDEWLKGIAQLPPTGMTHEQVIAALDAVRDEMGDLVER